MANTPNWLKGSFVLDSGLKALDAKRLGQGLRQIDGAVLLGEALDDRETETAAERMHIAWASTPYTPTSRR